MHHIFRVLLGFYDAAFLYAAGADICTPYSAAYNNLDFLKIGQKSS